MIARTWTGSVRPGMGSEGLGRGPDEGRKELMMRRQSRFLAGYVLAR